MRTAIRAAAAVVLLATHARAIDVLWIAETSDYNSSENWLGSNVPSADFGERAVINNGGMAQLTAVAAAAPGAVLVAAIPGATGALEILTGGSLNVAPTGSLAGNVLVGSSSGGGALRILSRASLTAPGVLASPSNPANRIELGGAGEGDAVVAVGAASFAGTTLIHPNVQFTAAYSPTTGATGAITLADSSVFAPTIASAGAALLTADGAITLDGKLQPTFSGFTPTSGQSWDLLQGSSVSGAFDSLDLSGSPLLAGLMLNVTTTNPSPGIYRVSLHVESHVSLDADFNGDDRVDALDLAIWRMAFGAAPSADADNDADSDGADFLAWQSHFGDSLAAFPPASTIPEPAALILLALSAQAIVSRRPPRPVA
jgi:hypothetical protein